MHTSDAIVVAQALRKTFPRTEGGPPQGAVNDVSLQARTGQLTALVGPDGAGKTSLIRMMAGLLKIDGGTLTVLGHDVAREPQAVQDRLGYMPQRFGLYEDLSVQENLDLYADLHGVTPAQRRERFARLLEMTDLAQFTQRPAGKLSGGMKQKLGLACTLVRRPDLLLLDEPSVGVDPLSRRELWGILRQLVDQDHLSVVVSTAYMDEAERCAQIYVLRAGKVLAQGDPAALRARAQGLTFTARPPAGTTPRALQARLIDAVDEIIDAVPRGGEVHAICRPEVDARQLDALVPREDRRPRPEELEDALMMLLRQHQDKAPPAQDVTVAPVAPTAVPAPAPAAGHDDAPVIRVRNLVRKFGDFTAVARTSFDVKRGEIFGLLGPNGAGKSTTFRMLCGLLPATSGQLEVAGHDLRTARAQARRRIGYVAQRFALYGNLSVRQNLQFFGGAYGLRSHALRRRIDAVLAQFHLEPGATSGQLPLGYKQRLAMAAGLLHEPEILFLDEPTSGIDPLARRAFWRSITTLAQTGVTIIITTHFMEEAEYCDRVAIQDAGRVLALGTPRQVRQQAGTEGVGDMNDAFIAIVEQARSHSEGAATQGRA